MKFRKIAFAVLMLFAFGAFGANESSCLEVLLRTGGHKVTSVLAPALASRSGKNITTSTLCEKKDLLEFEKDGGVRFEDCTFIVNEKIDENFEKGIVISFQIQSTLIKGKASKPVLNKSLLHITKF